VAEFSQLNWIVEKASELLADKVKDAPLSDRDVEIAFDIFARGRLDQLRGSFKDDFDEAQAKNYVLTKLHEKAKQLNTANWGEER
jgi:hypothetical protein